MTVTACAERHNAEVAQSWDLGAAPASAPGFGALIAAGSRSGGGMGDCSRAEADYMDYRETDSSADWITVKPSVISTMIAAPADQRSAVAGWTACIVAADHREWFTGSIRAGVRDGTAWSSNFGTCLGVSTSTRSTLCSARHRLEILGWFNPAVVTDAQGLYTGPVAADLLLASCHALVATMTGAPDPTYGGALEIGAGSLSPGWVFDVSTTADTGVVVATTVARPVCSVEIIGDASLTGTLIGLGDRPLPLL